MHVGRRSGTHTVLGQEPGDLVLKSRVDQCASLRCSSPCGRVARMARQPRHRLRYREGIVAVIAAVTGAIVTACGSDILIPPQLSGGSEWDCAFPPEADADKIDFARVTLVVTVRPDGTPQDVQVVRDPGHGFGREARRCAMRHHYEPGIDSQGKPVLATTTPFALRFTR